MDFKNGVIINIQAAGYNGVSTVYIIYCLTVITAHGCNGIFQYLRTEVLLTALEHGLCTQNVGYPADSHSKVR